MQNLIPVDRIENKIYHIRNQKVMLDRDLAELYGVETRTLVQAVKRNTERFPGDCMFQLSKQELDNWRSQRIPENGIAPAAVCVYRIGHRHALKRINKPQSHPGQSSNHARVHSIEENTGNPS